MAERPPFGFQGRVREALFPRIEFEQRTFRSRLARRIAQIFLLMLVAWIAGWLAVGTFSPETDRVPLVAILASVALLGGVGLLAMLMLRRQKVLAAGYILAGAVFLTGAAGVFFYPQRLLLYGPNILLATLLAGAIIGGGAAFLFAGFGIAISAAGWYYVTVRGVDVMAVFDLQTIFLQLAALSMVSVAAAALLNSMSNQVSRTIDRLHHQAVRLANLANTDPLTELANRRYLIDQMQREFERSRRYTRPLSLLYIDLDGFKAVNDQHGHLFGDDVLRGAAKAMSAVLRSTDLMARIGGDEFAVLMPETSLQEAHTVVNKLRRALHAFSDQLGSEVPTLTFCAGLSQMKSEDVSIEEMLQRADEAQYLAKETGKDHTRTQLEIGG